MRLFDRINQDAEEVEIKQGSEENSSGTKLRDEVETKLSSSQSNTSTVESQGSSEVKELKKQNEEIIRKLNKVLDKLDDGSGQGEMNGVL